MKTLEQIENKVSFELKMIYKHLTSACFPAKFML